MDTAVKRIVFGVMGFVLLLMFISYGIDLIFGASSLGTNITYLQSEVAQTSYGFEYTKYTWDYIGYAENLNFKEIFDSIERDFNVYNFQQMLAKSREIRQAGDGNFWETVWQGIQLIWEYLKFGINMLALVINVILVWLIRIPTQIIRTILSIVGIRMTYGSWWLASTLGFMTNELFIPLIP